MKRISSGALVLVIAVATSQLATAQRPPAPPQQRGPGAAAVPTTPRAALQDIQQTYGFVPQFLRAVPAAMLPSFWMMLKGFEENPRTALDAKTKELIGLAVAAQIPCDYCTYFHTVSAKMNGASDEEIKEATGVAAMTRLASTVLNGMQVDQNQFRKDVDRLAQRQRQQAQNIPIRPTR